VAPHLTNEVKLGAGWRLVELGNSMVLTADARPISASQSYPNLGIYSYGRGVFGKPAIEGARTSAKLLNRVRAEQFIYSRLFAFEGAYAYVPEAFDGCFVSNEFPTFDPDPEQLDSRWLAAYMRSPARWAELAGSSKGLGVRRQRIPVDALLEYKVWLPPIEKQRSMVSVLTMLQDAQSARKMAQLQMGSLVPASINEAFAGLS
jgi:type I restriction enzyme S subunit